MVVKGSNKIYSSTGRDIGSDTMTSSLVVIDLPHHELHEGNHYSQFNVFTIASNTTYQNFNILTGTNTSYAHIVPEISTNGPVKFIITEDPTLSSAGSLTAFQPVNNNR